jgi:hypothetical protein
MCGRRCWKESAPSFSIRRNSRLQASCPTVPPLCRVPDHKAGYKLQSFGYDTKVSMNGFDYDPVGDGMDQQMIIGGLANGHNEITLQMQADFGSAEGRKGIASNPRVPPVERS